MPARIVVQSFATVSASISVQLYSIQTSIHPPLRCMHALPDTCAHKRKPTSVCLCLHAWTHLPLTMRTNRRHTVGVLPPTGVLVCVSMRSVSLRACMHVWVPTSICWSAWMRPCKLTVVSARTQACQRSHGAIPHTSLNQQKWAQNRTCAQASRQ